MIDYAAIIEREFRNAVNTLAPLYVELGDELITVWYRMATYQCDCDSDEEFIFVCLENPAYTVRFPIPEDYLK
jgi:hypothetical protein